MVSKTLFYPAVFLATSGIALAGAPVPLPAAGSIAGPIGLVVAIVAYLGYRFFRRD